MRKLCPFSACLLGLTACCALGPFAASPAFAQVSSPHTAASLSGNVVDPQGALIPHANITLTSSGGQSLSTTADDLGHYTFDSVTPGTYSLEASADGFRSLHREGVLIAAGEPVRLALTMTIEVQEQQVEVSGNDLDASPDKNGDAIVLGDKELQALSNDPNELQMQLQAMAGADPQSGPELYVDGFSGGKMPPKAAIREIRINQNPYSAEYDKLGFGRIEIFTKPGADKLHVDYFMSGNDSSFNSKNPFVTTQPPYYSYQYGGDVNGPIRKNMSFFAEGYGQNGINDVVVNATVLDPTTLNQVPLVQAISSPTRFLDFSERVDAQVGKVQTLTLRYQLEQNRQTNAGIGQFNLPSQGYNLSNTEQILQLSDTQAYGAKIVNETRFQYIRDRNDQTSIDQSPTIIVTGAFTGGGNSLGNSNDKQDHYEFQDYLHIAAGKHDVSVGGRLRAIRDSNRSTSNFNGQFTFASLDAYQITEQGIQNGLTAAQIRANGGGAIQFSQTQGNPNVAVSVIDLGLYAEDNWKIKPSLTFSYGMRFESQTQMHDHADFAPRVAVSWAIPGAKNKPPHAVIRGGGGYFYDRFQSTNVLQAARQNGITESQVFVTSPDFYPATCSTDPTDCAAGASSSAPTIYTINPHLQAPNTFIVGIGVDKPISKYGQISANYIFQRREHQFLTRNINAPLPGTYDVNDPTSGTRPLGTDQNVYQYESEGAAERQQLRINGNLHIKQGGLFANYNVGNSHSNTQGISSFPSNSYNLHQDYGRGIDDIHQRLFLGAYSELPGHFSVNPFVFYESSIPFNITVPQDLNGDSIFNDRPAFATDLTRPSVYKTKYGNFDASPIAGQTIIPINYGNGPGMVTMAMRVNRNFSFGPKVPDEVPPPPPADAAKDDKAKDDKAKDDKTKDDKTKDAKATAKADAAKPAPKPVKKPIERKYNLSLGVESMNVFNHVNYGPPVGVLGSSLFGQSTSTSSIFGSGSANRTVNFEMYFHF